MNKNLNNQNDKGAQRGQMQNQGSRLNDTTPQGGTTNLNRDKEPNRVESWSNPSPDNEKGIHPIEPTVEKNLNRERETPSVGKGPNENRERYLMETTAERNMDRDKRTNGTSSEPVKNVVASGGSFSTRTQAMNDRQSASKSSAFQINTPIQERKMTDELKAPAMMGTVLYVIAAILLIVWAVGFFYYNAGPAIHILLILALVSVLIKSGQEKMYNHS